MFKRKSPLHYLAPEACTEENIRVVQKALLDVENNYYNIPVNSIFSYESLSSMKEHKWMKNCEMTLIEGSMDSDEEDALLEELYYEIISKAPLMSKQIGLDEELSVIAVDTETYNLSTRFQNINGVIERTNNMTGICLSSGIHTDGKEYGWYIPIEHTEEDGVQNLSQEAVRKFMTKLLQNTFTIYHNANFDREVLASYKIVMSPHYTDTHQLAIHVGWLEDHMQAGLKYLSQEMLDRQMVELKDLMGSKEHIQTDRLPAKNIYVYGASDAIITHAIFREFINYSDVEDGYENPYEVSKLAILTDTRSMDNLRAMFRLGLPVDREVAKSQMKTLLRRYELLWDEIYEIVPESVKITSNEQIGIWIGSKLERDFRNTYEEKQVEEKLVRNFTTAMENLFKSVRKVKTLKAGSKITYSCDKNTLAAIYENIDDVPWVSDVHKLEIGTLAEKMLDFNTVDTMLNYKKIVRHAYSDSFGFSRFSGGLKTNGANVTSRYSNLSAPAGNKGALERIQIKEMKRGKVGAYKPASPAAGINIQGISSDAPNYVSTRKITKIPKAIEDSILEMDRNVDQLYIEMVENIE